VKSHFYLVVTGTLLFGPHIAISLGTAAEIVVESIKPAVSQTAPLLYGVTREDARRIAGTLPGVRCVVPVREMEMRAVSGDRQRTVRFLGTTPEFSELEDWTLEQGRLLLQKDLDNRNNVAVVDTTTSRHLFPDGQAIGRNIRISKDYFLIVGLVAPRSVDSREACVMIPLTTMQSRFGDTVVQARSGNFQLERYELSRIRVGMESAASAEQGAASIQSLMSKYHEKRDYAVRTRLTPASR
jgi:hypothetical protein